MTDTKDPIFQALKAFAQADAACIAVNGNVPDAAMDKRDDAYEALLQTRPTTPAGLIALTTWARQRADWLSANASALDGKDLCRLMAAVDDSVRALIGGHSE